MRKMVVIDNTDNMIMYDVTIEERPYLDKDVISDFVTDMVFATKNITEFTKDEYKKVVMSSILCNFEIKRVHYMSKIYLN